MGIIKSGVLGPVRNKIGNTVSRMHRNLNVVSAIHPIIKRVPTAAQSEVRDRFGLLSNFLSRLDDLINIGFKHYAKGKLPLNVAYTYNYEHAFVSDETSLKLNYPKIMYSRGYISAPESPVLVALPDQIEFSWLPQRQSNYCQFTDLATFVVYIPGKQMFLKFKAATDRYAQGYLINLKGCKGETVHGYMSFASKDGKKQGNSTYVGELVCR